MYKDYMEISQNSIPTRTCFRCKAEKPATLDFFYKDAPRPLGVSYECKECLSARKMGRDRRTERWGSLSDEQKSLAKKRQQRYNKTDKGRAIFLRKAYQRIDHCDLTTNEVLEFIIQPCVHCGTKDNPRGLDRIDNKLPHIKGNVAPACAPCNFARGDRFSFEEMQKIGAVIRQIMRDRLSGLIPSEAHL